MWRILGLDLFRFPSVSFFGASGLSSWRVTGTSSLRFRLVLGTKVGLNPFWYLYFSVPNEQCTGECFTDAVNRETISSNRTQVWLSPHRRTSKWRKPSTVLQLDSWLTFSGILTRFILRPLQYIYIASSRITGVWAHQVLFEVLLVAH